MHRIDCSRVLLLCESSVTPHIEPLSPFIYVIALVKIIYIINRQFGENRKPEILGRTYRLGFNILPAPQYFSL